MFIKPRKSPQICMCDNAVTFYVFGSISSKRNSAHKKTSKHSFPPYKQNWSGNKCWHEKEDHH